MLFVSLRFDRFFFSFFNKTIELENAFGCFWAAIIMVNPNYLPYFQHKRNSIEFDDGIWPLVWAIFAQCNVDSDWAKLTTFSNWKMGKMNKNTKRHTDTKTVERKKRAKQSNRMDRTNINKRLTQRKYFKEKRKIIVSIVEHRIRNVNKIGSMIHAMKCVTMTIYFLVCPFRLILFRFFSVYLFFLLFHDNFHATAIEDNVIYAKCYMLHTDTDTK